MTGTTGRAARGALIGLAALARWLVAGPAFAEPPIKSPQDAACRNEARGRVFVTPDPQGIGLHALGRQIYTACMERTAPRRRRRR